MSSEKELLERLVGMVADVQQSQLSLSSKLSNLENRIDTLTNIVYSIDKRLERVEIDLDNFNSIQLNLVKRVRKLEEGKEKE